MLNLKTGPGPVQWPCKLIDGRIEINFDCSLKTRGKTQHFDSDALIMLLELFASGLDRLEFLQTLESLIIVPNQHCRA
jgi:hypothetical protein